jgi:hypothetical protein
MPRPGKPFWKKSHEPYYANIGGKPVRLGTTWEDAEKEFFRLKFEQKAAPPESGQKGTNGEVHSRHHVEMVVDVCTKYLAHVQKNRSERTYEWYRDTLKIFCKEVGKNLAVDADDPLQLHPGGPGSVSMGRTASDYQKQPHRICRETHAGEPRNRRSR